MKIRIVLLLVATTLALLAATALGAPPAPRPYSGCGVLLLHEASAPGLAPEALYTEPGLDRISEFTVAALPKLPGEAGEQRLAVSATRGSWLKVAYDDAGREGWIEPPRSWEYLPWSDYLPGRTVRILPGMKKAFYLLKGAPRATGPERGALSRDQQVRVVRIEKDWALIQEPAGWFRWRDDDGRLTVSP